MLTENIQKMIDGILNNPADGEFSNRNKNFLNMLNTIDQEITCFAMKHGKTISAESMAELKKIDDTIKAAITYTTWGTL